VTSGQPLEEGVGRVLPTGIVALAIGAASPTCSRTATEQEEDGDWLERDWDWLEEWDWGWRLEAFLRFWRLRRWHRWRWIK